MSNIKQLFRKYDDGNMLLTDETYHAVDGYQHVQSTPLTEWFIPHNKGTSSFSINVFSNNKLVECDIEINDNYSITLKFSEAVTGFANILFLIDRSKKVIPPTPSVSITPSPTPTPSVTPTPSPLPVTQYKDVVLSKNPIAYWSLDDLTDDVTQNILTLGSNASLSADSFGNVLQFDQSVATSNLGAFMATPFVLRNSYTLEAWIKPTTFISGNFSTVFGDTTTNNYGLQLEVNSTTNANLFLYGGADALDSAYSVTLPTNYIHVVMTVDSNSNVGFYINGSKVNTTTLASTDTYSYGIIGADTFDPDEAFIGFIGDPAIYDHVLTDVQILENYNAGLNYRYQS